MKQIPHNMNNIFRLLTVVLSVSIGREKKANDTSSIDMKIRLSYDLFSAIYKIGVCVCVFQRICFSTFTICAISVCFAFIVRFFCFVLFVVVVSDSSLHILPRNYRSRIANVSKCLWLMVTRLPHTLTVTIYENLRQ